MIISPRVIAAAERRAQSVLPDSFAVRARTLARETETVRRIREQEAQIDPDKFYLRQSYVALGGVKPSDTELERLLGTNDLVDEFYLERALIAAMPVCRISIRTRSGHERGCATGFMISPRLLLTNWHVFRDADEAMYGIAEFNYRDDVKGNPMTSYRFNVRPDLFYFSHQALDFCIVSVERQAIDGSKSLADFGFHRVFRETGKIKEKEWMTIIQHPAGKRRQHAIRENQLVKILDNHLWYMSDTAQGSSGAPVFNDSFQLVALHHSGKARKDNQGFYVLKSGRRVKSLDTVDETDVDWIANEGVRISKICEMLFRQAKEADNHLKELEAAMEGGDILSTVYEFKRSISNSSISNTQKFNPGSGMPNQLPIYLDFRFSVNGQPMAAGTPTNESQSSKAAVRGSSPTAKPDELSSEFEALKEPIIDTDYTSRKGFKENYLKVTTPLPEVKDLDLVAKMDDGDHIIPYEHFSVVMHKQRRSALFTASNVDGRAKSKNPEPGNYTRKGLTGLGKNDSEKWVTDPRIPDLHQLPDKFFTNDRKSFDKGHIVRREDVCWGASYAQIRRANGDTYHTTNCSPQVNHFNQSSKDGLWGQLEDHILDQAKTEKYNIFAGPILSDEDEEFEGVDQRGKVRIKVPSKFWKLVLAMKGNKLQAFAFILEQDLSGVQMEEFQITADWKPHMVSVKKLEKMVRFLKFDQVIHKADQHKKPAGDEVENLSTNGIEMGIFNDVAPESKPKARETVSL